MENDFLKPLNDYLKSYKTERENGEIFRVRRDENGKIIDKVRAYSNNNRPLDLLPAEEKPVSIWDVKRKIPFTTALADPDEAEYGLLTQTLEVPKERFFGLKKLDVKTGDIINSGMAEVFKFPSVKLLAGPKEVKETALNGEAQRTAAAIKAGANWSMNALKNVFEGLVTIGDSAIEAFAKPAPEDYEFMPEKAKAVWENGLKLDAEKRNKETAFALKQFEDFAQSVIEKTGTNLNAGARPDEALVYEGTQAAMSLLGAIGVTVLAKNPSAGAAFFGAMQLGDTTSEGLKAGLSYQKAKAAGFTDAAWVSATELIGLKTYLSAIKANNLIANAAGRILAKTPKNLTARFAAVTAAGAFTEGAQEYIQDTGTDLIKNAYGVQNEALGDILQKNIMSFVWGAVMGGGFGAAFNGASVLKTMGQVQSDLQKAGLPEEQARALAQETAAEILSEDFVRDLTGPLIKEMSPMTYPDFDKNKVAQNLEAAIAEQKDRTKQLIDISAGYEEALKQNGAKEEEAQAAGRILANIVDNIAKKNKVLPKTAESFLNFKIERQAEDLPPAAQESYAQAAMYKTPHKDFEDFYNAAQNNKGKKQSYYTFTTQGGTNIDIPSDSLLHDKKHPEMNPEEWKRVLTNIDNIEEGLALKSKQGSKYKGIPLLLKVKGKDATYGVALELLDNGRILLTTAFKGTGKKGVDAWLKQVKNAGTPDTLVFDFRLTTDNSRRATTSGHSSFYSLSDIAEAVKAEDLPPAAQESYGQAAMYKSRANSLAEFKRYAENSKKQNKQYYVINGEEDITVPQERIISGDNKKLSPEDLELIENSLKRPDIKNYEILQGRGAYNGIRVVLNIKTAKGDLNTLMEIAESGKIFLEKAKFNESIKKLAGMRALKASAVSPGLVNSLSDIVDIVNSEFEKNIEQKPASEIINITNEFKERINARESRTYNKDNFYRKTTGDFKTAQAPSRAPDFVSASSSKYWYEDYGVFRQADHWGKVSSNEWTLDGKESSGAVKTGYAKWEDFAYNGAKDKARLAKYENALNKKLSEEQDFNSYDPQGEKASFDQEEAEDIFTPSAEEKTKYEEDLKKAEAGELKSGQLIKVGSTPQIYLDMGLPKGSLNLPVTVLRKAVSDKHNMKMGDMRRLPELVYNPIMVFKSATVPGNLVAVVDAKDESKRQALVILKPANNGINIIPSVYGRNNFTAFVKNNIKNGNLLYLDEKRAAEFVRPQELQSPKGNKADGFFNNIPTKEDVVKRYGQGKRGSIDLSKKGNVYYALVKIMQTGDKSTLLHELGHLWLYTAQDIYAEDEFKETKKDLDEWLGKPQVKAGRYVYTRAQQEKLAQGLETYLMEGKAPAPALKSVFEKIRQWFMDIYNGALVEMSEAGRAVYDRMFELSGRDVEEHLKLYQDEVKTKKTRKAIKQLREEGKTDVEGLTLRDIEEYLSVLDMGAPPLPKATLRTYLRKYGANYAGAGRVDAEAYKNARIPNRKEGIGDDLARRLIDWGFLAGEIDTYEDLNRLNREAAEMIERALNGEDVYRLEDLPAVEQFEAYMEAAKTAEDALGGKIEEYRRVKEIIKGLRLEGYRPVSAKDIDFVAAQIEELEEAAREEAEDALNPKIEKARKEAEAWKNTADKRQEDLHKAKAAARAEFEEKLKAFTESEMPDAENYKNPSKDCILPPLNTADLKLLNKKSKPVVLKKNIIEKEKKRHPEIPTEEYNEILAKALYGATAILQVKPKTKPNYFTFLRENEKGQSAVLEMAENKDNFEVVSFLKIDRPRVELYKKNTRREGGEFLITERSEPQGAAHLSALASDNKSITEKERKVNQRVRAVKKAVISEINKREIENKEALLKELKEAKEAKDILDAAGILLEKLEAEYAKTEEGKAERRKLDAPATDWGAKKAGVLKEINALMQSAEEKTRQAQAVLEEESRAKLGYRGPLTEEEKAAANRAKAFLKENFTPRLTAVLQKALSGEEHLSPADVNRMIAHTAGTVSHFKKSLNQQINGLMAWAEKTQKENYNRYIWRKIDTELKRKAFEKSGNVKKAKLSQRAFDFLQKAREYWGLKTPEFTLENLTKPLRAEDITEIHNQVTGEAIPLKINKNLQSFAPVELKSNFLPKVKNGAEGKRQILDNIFGENKELPLKKDGKTFVLSRSSAKKIYNTALKHVMEYADGKKLTGENRYQLYHDANEQLVQALKIFDTAQLILSHKDVKNVKDRVINRYGNIFKYKGKTFYAMFVCKEDGKLADLHLYDLQTEELIKRTAGISSDINIPSQQRPKDNIKELVKFVKRKIAKYNKNLTASGHQFDAFGARLKPYSLEELLVILNARQDKAMAAVQNGDIYPVEEALLNGVLEFLVNGKENNPADSQKLFEDVSALLKAGRANKLREKLRKQLSREYLREALNQALRNRKLPFGAKWFLNLPDTNYKQFLLNAFGVIEHEEVNENGELVKTKTNLADALDTLKGQRGTALYKYEKGQQLNDIFRTVLDLKSNGAVLNKIAELQKTVFTAENYMRALNEADGAEQARILQDGKWLAEQDIDQDDLNKLEIMSIYEWYKNTQPETREDGSIVDYGLRGRLLRQYGQAQLDQMFALLSEPEKRLADVLQQFTAAQWARENAVFREMHGFSLPQDPNYLPSVARRMDIGGDTDYIKQYINASANPSFIKKRVKSFRVAMKPTSILEIVQNHTNRAAEYINEALTFNLIKGVFKSEKIERAFESAAGREDGKKLYDKLLRLIDLQGPQIKKSAGSSPVMEFIFNGWVKSAMALKATVGAKQFATGISFAEKMPFHVWAKYFLEGMAKPKATYDFMLKNVPHIEVRFAQGSINESLQRAMAARDLNLLQTRWNNLTNALMFNIRWGDKASFVYGGYPYYKYLTEDLKLSPQEARAKVEEQGESTLQSSQKALLGEYQANADNYAARIYTVFRNQSKQYFGKLATSYIQYKNGEISAADFGKTWLLYAALNPMIYTLLGFAWLYPGKDDDGEEKAQKGVFDVLASPITGLASVNAFAEAGVKYLLDAVYAKSKNQKLPALGSVAMPAFEDIQRDVNKAVKAYNDAGGLEELLGEMSLTDSINSLAALLKYTGLPAQTALNAAGGVKDVFDGKTAKGLLRAAGYTEYRAGQMTGEKKKKTKKRRKKQRRNN